MSHSEASSLLDFVDSPIIVGDPDSRVLYVNPSFERRLGIAADAVRGESLSSLFEGGSRESVLKAVADVCEHGRTANFKLREGGHDYLAQASPIQAEGDSVGVVILLTDEPPSPPRPHSLLAQVSQPVAETIACLQELAVEITDPRTSEIIDRGLSGLEQLQKLGNQSKADGPRAREGSFQPTLDPVRVARQAADRVSLDLERVGGSLDLLIPQHLPLARGPAEGVETTLVEVIRHHLQQSAEDSQLTLSARVIGGPGRQSLLFSVVQLSAGDGSAREVVTEASPRAIRERIQEFGGGVYSIASESLGRVTSIQLQLAS